MGANVCQDADQRQAALKLANVVRTTNAKTLKTIGKLPCRDGLAAVAKLLMEADEKGPAGALKIGRLLMAPRHMGEMRIQGVLHVAGIVSQERALRLLTKRQREVMAWEITRCLPQARETS
jgi:hypothetical protein